MITYHVEVLFKNDSTPHRLDDIQQVVEEGTYTVLYKSGVTYRYQTSEIFRLKLQQKAMEVIQ